jgi:phosphatidylserine/phosphatidylglycerophosphate/cardiolipin synthase-like enzyme
MALLEQLEHGIHPRLALARLGTLHMHHKLAVFDSEAVLTGSYNWTCGATHNNLENFVVTYERRPVEIFAARFEETWSDLA